MSDLYQNDKSRKTPEDSLSLESCFRQILKGNALELDTENVYELLNNLNINMNGLQPKLTNILPFLLVHFIKIWPGWQKGSGKEISFNEWFQKFKEYLSFKLNFIIKSEIQKLCEEVEQFSIDAPYLFGIDNSTQTDVMEKPLAPFTIEVQAPARFLSTMIFGETLQDEIILKECNIHLPWPEKLTVRQIINWPNVEVEYKSKELHFKISNSHLFERFLGNEVFKLPDNPPAYENGIVEIDIIERKVCRKSYSLNVIREYCNMYLGVLKKQQQLLSWTGDKINELQIILEDLMLDISDINKNSIATNSSILFNIGCYAYSRNKSLKNNENLKLTDLITPRTLLSFIQFSAFADSGSDPFPLLTKMEKEVKAAKLKDMIPKISYRCTFCEVNFSELDNIWRHLKITHAMEQPVNCFKCKQQFTVLTLTSHRWRHQCQSTSDSTNSTKT